MGVIDPLEVVDVIHDDCKRCAVTPGPLEFSGQHRIEPGSVERPGQRIDGRLYLERPGQLSQFPVLLLQPGPSAKFALQRHMVSKHKDAQQQHDDDAERPVQDGRSFLPQHHERPAVAHRAAPCQILFPVQGDPAAVHHLLLNQRNEADIAKLARARQRLARFCREGPQAVKQQVLAAGKESDPVRVDQKAILIGLHQVFLDRIERLLDDRHADYFLLPVAHRMACIIAPLAGRDPEGKIAARIARQSILEIGAEAVVLAQKAGRDIPVGSGNHSPAAVHQIGD